MNIFIFSSLIIGFILVSLYVGKRASTNIETSEDYYLSGRKLGVFSLSLTFLATQLGGGAIVGAADAAYIYGWQAIYYALGISLGLFLLSLGVGSRLRQKQISTIPQIFSNIYGDQLSYKLCSAIYIISTFLILIAVAVATKKYLVAIECYNYYIFLAFWSTLIIYTSVGGLKAVVQTDVIQISGVLVIFLITFIYLLINPVEVTMVNDINNDLVIPWSSWLLMPLLFTLIGQDMGQRCFSGATAKTVTMSTFIAGVLLLLSSMLPTYLGIVANQIGIEINENASILISVINQITNPTISAFFAFAVLMAIISTADSLLCAISSNIAIDIFANQTKNKNTILYARVVTFVSGILAFLASLYANNIIQIMVQAYEITIICFFVPIIIAIFSSSPSKLAARISIFVGMISYVLMPKEILGAPYEILCLCLSAIGYLFGYVIDRVIKI